MKDASSSKDQRKRENDDIEKNLQNTGGGKRTLLSLKRALGVAGSFPVTIFNEIGSEKFSMQVVATLEIAELKERLIAECGFCKDKVSSQLILTRYNFPNDVFEKGTLKFNGITSRADIGCKVI